MKLFAIDTETTLAQLRFDKVRDKFEVPDLVCVACAREGKRWVRPWDARHLEWALEIVLRDNVAVGHNVAFDLAVLLKEFPGLRTPLLEALREGRVLDTMVLARLREPRRRRYGLEVLAESFLGERLEGKGDVQVSFTRDRPLTLEQRSYATQDAGVTLRLAEVLLALPLGSVYEGYAPRHEIRCGDSCELIPGPIGHPLDRLYSTCLIYTRLFVEPLGWDMDLDLLRERHGEALSRLDELSEILEREGMLRSVRDTAAPTYVISRKICLPRKWTLNSDGHYYRLRDEHVERQASRRQLRLKKVRTELRKVAGKLGLRDAPTSVKTGDISVTYDYWKLYRDRLSEGLRAFLEYVRAQKYDGLFFRNWTASRTGRVYPAFYVPGTETLRHASSKPNFHQLPKKLRGIFRSEGRRIVGADYRAMETYALCHVMASMGIRGPIYEVLDTGKDIHCTVAAMFLGGEPESYLGTAARQQAKALAHGIPGGLGPGKIYLRGKQEFGLDWSLEECRNLYYQFKNVFWDVAEYLKKFKRLDPWDLAPEDMSREEWLESLGFQNIPSTWDLTRALDGGRIYDVVLPCGVRLPGRLFTQAANCTFQATGGVVVTRALNLAIEAGLPVVAAVHDAIYLAVPENESDHARRLEGCMERALGEVCPLAPPQKVRAEIHETFF